MFSRFATAPLPCVRCNRTELLFLHEHYQASDEEFWIYELAVMNRCSRCDRWDDRRLWNSYINFPMIRNNCCFNPKTVVQIPLPVEVVGSIERNMHSSSTATSGSAFRAHGAFISLLSGMNCSEKLKQALCCYAPCAMKAFMDGNVGVSRKWRSGRLSKQSEGQPPLVPPPKEEISEKVDVAEVEALNLPPANPGTESGMLGTQLAGDEFGEETRVKGLTFENEPKILAHPIGPDLIPTECFDNTKGNMKAGMAKRVKPLPWKADKAMVRKIERTVTALIKEVFPEEKIKQWRTDNPLVEEFCSSKWSPDRFRRAFEEAMAETNAKIEQTFQIKTNEALPAKGKAPRPIIQCGDKAQVMMALPVKCFEELLFDFFETASIKHCAKYDAMVRVAKHLQQPNANLVEGDGSAWDSCCNPTIRKLTENRIIRYIIEVLGSDHEIPRTWMKAVLDDMEKPKLRGKVKVNDFTICPVKVTIDAIRQSGHRGTSCFNYLINLVSWLCVLCDKPEEMISKKNGKLQQAYISPRDGVKYMLKYAFEGDDSALSTTENLKPHEAEIEKLWTQLGFRMKLVYVEDKLTFTGFDFLCDGFGPTGTMVPEIARNIASASWTTSPLVRQFPSKRHEVGAAAMLARAENFKDCGPLSAYFAALGLAHCEISGDRGISEAEAKSLAINVSPSIKERLHELMGSAEAMDTQMLKLVSKVHSFTQKQQMQLLSADFGKDPYDLSKARRLIPFKIWDPKNFEKPRR